MLCEDATKDGASHRESDCSPQPTNDVNFFDQFSTDDYPDLEPISLDFIYPPPGEDISRDSRLRLEQIQECVNETGPRANSWGYTIYRTVYTPESDLYFSTAIERITAYAKEDATSVPERYLSTGSAPEDELWRRWQCDIIEDKTLLDGADIERIGQLFSQRIADQMGTPYYGGDPRHNLCIMIDQEVLDQILLLPEDAASDDDAIHFPYVKIITRVHSPSGRRRWIQCAVVRLVELWFSAALFRDIDRLGKIDIEDGRWKWTRGLF